MKQNFYERLTSFRDFSEIASSGSYYPAPPDWHVVITDVAGSTAAIADGRYRDVNTLGAASIVVARKVMEQHDFPFVFGGDGATILVPPEYFDELLAHLHGLRRLSEQQFGLGLRVGAVCIAELHDAGHRVEIGKYEETPGQPVAILRGDGVSVAEKWVKENPEVYQTEVQSESISEPDLGALSCRWQAIPEQRGRIISLLVHARTDRIETYGEILARIEAILPDGINAHNPVDVSALSYKTIAECLRDEHRYHESIWSFAFGKRAVQILIAVLAFRYHFPVFLFDPKHYARSLPLHTDFRKFDDMLRMTLDCSPQQVKQIRDLLEQRYRDGDINYGLFESDQTLMTCFVEGLNDGQHFHFIDADNGGYAIAAIGMKQQMATTAVQEIGRQE